MSASSKGGGRTGRCYFCNKGGFEMAWSESLGRRIHLRCLRDADRLSRLHPPAAAPGYDGVLSADDLKVFEEYEQYLRHYRAGCFR